LDAEHIHHDDKFLEYCREIIGLQKRSKGELFYNYNFINNSLAGEAILNFFTRCESSYLDPSKEFIQMIDIPDNLRTGDAPLFPDRPEPIS
jgi:hypothetical protein